MAYFALLYDVVDQFTERRAVYRDEHLRMVRDLHARGEVVMGGALGDPPDGAMLIFKSPSATSAEEFAKHDPYVTNGLVTRWSVRPWTVVVGP
jgi:uncharacterized protein YciI